jgi:hypothetical protein
MNDDPAELDPADLDAIDSGYAPWPETPLAGVIEDLDVCDHFVPADGDPGHCARCGQYDSDHEPTDEDIFRGER